MRLFVRVQTAPIEVKKIARFVDEFCNGYYFLIDICSQTSVYYVCSGCQSFHEQPLGRVTERINDRSGNPTVLFKAHVGPPVSEKCPECESPLHVAGPMWNGQIHDPHFVGQMLGHLEDNESKYGTSTRMKGMLTVAKEVETLSHFFVTSLIELQRNYLCRSTLRLQGWQVSSTVSVPL